MSGVLRRDCSFDFMALKPEFDLYRNRARSGHCFVPNCSIYRGRMVGVFQRGDCKIYLDGFTSSFGAWSTESSCPGLAMMSEKVLWNFWMSSSSGFCEFVLLKGGIVSSSAHLAFSTNAVCTHLLRIIVARLETLGRKNR